MFKLGKAEPMDYGNSHMAEAIKDRPLKAKTIKDRSHQSVSTGITESLTPTSRPSPEKSLTWGMRALPSNGFVQT
jgi:hypothetical protein